MYSLPLLLLLLGTAVRVTAHGISPEVPKIVPKVFIVSMVSWPVCQAGIPMAQRFPV